MSKSIEHYKIVLCSLFATVMLIGSSTARAAVVVLPAMTVRDKWALVVGVSKFQNSKLDLKYAAKDAQDFADFLVKEGHFARDHVRVLIDEKATREAILSELGDRFLPRVALPGDLVVIYMASHGSPSKADVSGVNYLIAHNTDTEELYATGVPIQSLAQMIKDRVHCQRVVVILDACHSGAAQVGSEKSNPTNFDAEQLVRGTGQLVICSSQPDQRSWESRKHENGVFTYWLIEALKQKKGEVRLSEAFDFLREKVQEEVVQAEGELQSPVLRSKWTGDDLVLSAVPSRPRSAPVDETEKDLIPYMNKLQSHIKSHWTPPSDMGLKTITVRFLVHDDGTLSNVSVLKSSGNKEWDHKAIAAVFDSSPADKLPASAPRRVGMQCTFDCHGSASSCQEASEALKQNVTVLDMVVHDKAKNVDLGNAASKLTAQMVDALHQKFGQRLIDPRGAAPMLTSKNVATAANASAEYLKSVAAATGSRFVLYSSLEEVPLQGEKDKYLLVLSLKLVSGETGEVLWQVEGNSPKKDKAGQQASGIATYFSEIMLPDIVTYLSEQLPTASK